MPTFLTPWAMALAAGLTVPTLILFYFLKLRRQEVVVPSTLLWKRAVQDLQVNAPFQKLRKNLLLLLQLLVLLAAAVAIGRPLMRAERPHDQRLVLLLDHSASMNTLELDGRSRLEHAKDAARALIDGLGPNDQSMLIAFTDQASVLSPFTNDKAGLIRQLDAVEPTDRPTHMKEALQLAEHHSTPQFIEVEGASLPPESGVPQAQILLFSDGRIDDAADLVLRRGQMEMVRIGEQTDNVGIVALDVRRNYERPDRLSVFARVRNFSDRPVTTDVTLLINGQIRGVQTVADLAAGLAPQAAAATTAPTTRPASADAPPEGSVGLITFDEIPVSEAGVAEVVLSRGDAFSADNRAYAIIPPPRQMSVLLVTSGHYFLTKLLESLPLRTFDQMTPDEYEAADEDALFTNGRLRYDLVILDNHSTDNLPFGNYLFFEGAPAIDGVSVGDVIADEFIVTWDDSHPILRYVTFDDVEITSWVRYTLPEEAITLVEGETSPVVAYLAREGRQYVLVAFNFFNAARDRLNTTWYLRRSLVVFMYNTLEYLSGSITAADTRSIRPGEAMAVAAFDDADRVTITTPMRRTHAVPVDANRLTYFGQTDRVGLYSLDPAPPGHQHFAVNLFDENESLVAPHASLTIGSDAIEVREGEQLINKPLWPYLLLAALVVLFVEWYVYNKRVLI